jgi:glycosyltransferase involved in cell wall biosynthesis
MITSSYPRWEGDGAGSFIASLAQALVKRGHQVEVLAPWDQAVRPMDTAGVGVHRFRYAPSAKLHLLGHGRSLMADVRLKPIIPLLLPGYIIASMRCARALHRRQPFDIIHGQWSVPGGYIAGQLARSLKLPLIISLHGSDVYLTEHSRLYALAARSAFARARCVTAPSRHLLERSQSAGLAPAKTRVVPYGVDTARYLRAQGQALRLRLGLPSDAPVIGALGRLVYKKGFANLIAALPEIRKQAADVQCVIAGEGDLRDELTAQAQAMGVADGVHLIGHVAWQETPDFYAMCDVVALPSVVDAYGNVDGLPNVLLEAMASGRAVVASRAAGMDEVIVGGENGTLVPPGDDRALAQACIYLLGDAERRRALGDAARRLMSEQYDWQMIAERFEEVYFSAESTKT